MRDVIKTERLLLRPVRLEDAEAMYPHFENWNVVQWLGMPTWPGSIERMRVHIARCIAERETYELYRAIELDGTILGGISWRLRPMSDEQREAGPNIGYWLGEPYWGQGYMTEAAGALCRETFAATDAPIIFSGLFEGNPASLAVQAKLGFVVAGRSLKFSNVQQKDLPHVNTELTRVAFARRAA